MNQKEYKAYYDLTIKKWNYMAGLVSAVYPLLIVFVFLDPQSLSWTLGELYALSAVLSVIVWCLFYEWRHCENTSSFWGVKFRKIIYISIKRSEYLLPEKLEKRIEKISLRVLIIIILGVISWIFPVPVVWYLVAALIGDSYCKLVMYQLDEEKHAPQKYRQPITTGVGLLANFVMLGGGYFVLVSGVSFSSDNFAVYWFHVAGACALGAFVAVVSELPSLKKFYRSEGEH